MKNRILITLGIGLAQLFALPMLSQAQVANPYSLITRQVAASPSTLALVGASGAQGDTDLSMRAALYFTGSKTSQIDLKNDPFVSSGGSMELKASDGANCSNGLCEFNIGFVGFRSGNTSSALSSYGLLQVENGGLVGNTIYFAPAQNVKQGVLPLKLKMGSNRVTFTIDPYKKTAETNERNNSFSVTFNVAGGKQ
jgi:hypothetical protein